MPRKLRELQYLIDGQDGYLYIVNKQSIVVDENCEDIAISTDVKFLWPEDAACPRELRGKILHSSTSASVLEVMMKDIVRQRDRKGKRSLQETSADQNLPKRLKISSSKGEGSLPASTVKPSTSNSSIQERKKLANTLAAKDILKEIKVMQKSEDKSRAITKPSQLEDLSKKVNATLDTAKLVVESLSDIKKVLATHAETESVKSIYRLDLERPATPEQSDVLKELTTRRRSITPSPVLDNNEQLSPMSTRGAGIFAQAWESPVFVPTKAKELSSHLSTAKIVGSDEDDLRQSDSPSPASSFSSTRSLLGKRSRIARSTLTSALVPYDDESSDEKSEDDVMTNNQRSSRDDAKMALAAKSGCKNTDRTESSVQSNQQIDGDPEKKKQEARIEATEISNKYDKDGLWTLRHASMEKGKTRELMRGSEIFVRKVFLTSAIEGSRNQTGLARMLLEEVFTEEALIKCSLSGGSANGKGKQNDTEKKPGLNKKGVDAILSFIRKHAEIQKWPSVDDRTIKSSLRSKLTEMRKQRILNKEMIE